MINKFPFNAKLKRMEIYNKIIPNQNRKLIPSQNLKDLKKKNLKKNRKKWKSKKPNLNTLTKVLILKSHRNL